jgi:hypothetical protein
MSESSSTRPLPAPGWYGDPEGSPFRRYWDGTTWTSLETGDMSAFAPDATSPAPPGFYTDPGGSSTKRSWDGHAWGDLQVETPAPYVAPPVPRSVATTPSSSPIESQIYTPPPRPEREPVPYVVPPGMYPDPEDETKLRFWNGNDWAPAQKPSGGLFSLAGLSARLSGKSSRSSARGPYHGSAGSFLSRYKIYVAGGLVLLLILIIAGVDLTKGTTPGTNTTTTISASQLAEFCTTAASYNTTTKAGPGTVSATPGTSPRAFTLLQLKKEEAFAAIEVSDVARMIVNAPSSVVKTAYTTSQRSNIALGHALAGLYAKVAALPASASATQIRNTLKPYDAQLENAIAGAKSPLTAQVLQDVASSCATQDTTTTTTS